MRLKILLVSLIFLGGTLRFYHLGINPPSLYWDEASLGYNAFSISQTWRDEHGEFLPLTRFMAFGDYKPPGYIYAAALAVKIFGLTEFAVRFPSALAGTILILVTFLLVKELFKKSKLALVATILVTISPWAIQFSRGAFEANLATLLSTLGIYLFVKTLHQKTFLTAILSALSFVLSLYTFNSHRIFAPLMIVTLFLIYFQQVWSSKKIWVAFIFVFGLILLPLIPHMQSREGQLRFYEVTWLNDLAPIETSNQRIALDKNVWWASILHNRRVSFAQQFLKHYFDHFRADFLFFSGDVNPRLSIQTVGEMYWPDLVLLLFGGYFLVKKRSRAALVLLLWILFSPIPAATARETPHALRILQILPSLQIVAALGFLHAWKMIPSKYLRLVLLPIYLLFVLMYLHDYHIHFPKTYSSDWQYGYKEMVNYVSEIQGDFNQVNITDTLGRPYIYLLFYQKYSPEKYWANRQVRRDWYGFWYVDGFDKYTFGGTAPQGRTLMVTGPQQIPGDWQLLKTIYDPAGKTVFQISIKP